MLSRAQLISIYWFLRRRQKIRSKRRFYIRPAHATQLANSFRLFQRYYESDDPLDLKGFCRFSPAEFDSLHNRIEHQTTHMVTHRRSITSKQRVAVFLRYN